MEQHGSQYKISHGVKQGGCLSPTFTFRQNDYQLRYTNIGWLIRCNNYYIGVSCYADDFSLIYPSVSGIQRSSSEPILIMKNAQTIPYINKCAYVGNDLSVESNNKLVSRAIVNLNVKTTNVLPDFSSISRCDINTLSVLNTTCGMNMSNVEITNLRSAQHIFHSLAEISQKDLEITLLN